MISCESLRLKIETCLLAPAVSNHSLLCSQNAYKRTGRPNNCAESQRKKAHSSFRLPARVSTALVVFSNSRPIKTQ